MNDNLKHELKIIGFRSIFLNISAYLISFIFLGLNISMLIGLLLGTLVMFIYLIMLYRSIENTVSAGLRFARAKMMGGYLLRLLLIGILIVASFKLDFINPVGAILPIFYPKMIYVGGAIFKRKGGV